MAVVLTEKGVTWGYADFADGWGAATNNSLRTLSEYVLDTFAYDPVASTGLQYAFRAGVIVSGGVVTKVAAGTVTLASASTNYVERTATGVVSANTVGFTAGSIPLAVAVTSIGTISTVSDRRAPAMLQANGVVPGHAALGVPNTFTGLITAQSGIVSARTTGAAITASKGVDADRSWIRWTQGNGHWQSGFRAAPYNWVLEYQVSVGAPADDSGWATVISAAPNGNVSVGNQLFAAGNAHVGGNAAAATLGSAVVIQGAANVTSTGVEFWSGGAQRGYLYMNNTGAEWIALNGQDMALSTTGGIVLQADEVALRGTNGTWIGASDIGGSDALRVAGGVRASGTLTGAAVLVNEVRNTTGKFLRPDGGGDALLLGNGANLAYGALELRNAAGTVINATFADSGGLVVAGGVTASTFTGSGSALTSVPWSGLNAGTIPANVANAITQADGDGRYRRLSVAIGWADVTKPAAVTVNAVSNSISPTYSDLFSNNTWTDLNRDTWASQVQSTISSTVTAVAQIRALLQAAGFAP